MALSDDTARAIGEEARRWGISVSIHAPYYINCAALDPEKREKSFGYIMDSARVVTLMGGTRVVFHPGSEKGGHDEAMERALEFLRECIARLDAQGYSHINLCPETMGKCNTLGTLDDVIALCGVDARVVPTLDFAHIHARGQGALNTEADLNAYWHSSNGDCGPSTPETCPGGCATSTRISAMCSTPPAVSESTCRLPTRGMGRTLDNWRGYWRGAVWSRRSYASRATLRPRTLRRCAICSLLRGANLQMA